MSFLGFWFRFGRSIFLAPPLLLDCRALHADGRVGDGLQPRLGNLLAAILALAVAAVGDPFQGELDLIEGLFLAANQAQGKLLLEVVAAQVGQVDRQAAGFRTALAQGRVGHPPHLAAQAGSEAEKPGAIKVRVVLIRRWLGQGCIPFVALIRC